MDLLVSSFFVCQVAVCVMFPDWEALVKCSKSLKSQNITGKINVCVKKTDNLSNTNRLETIRGRVAIRKSTAMFWRRVMTGALGCHYVF